MSEKNELEVLRTIGSEFELNMITAILEDNSIPFIVKNKGAGSYMRILTGGSPFKTDILVDISDLERALDLIEPVIGE